VETFVVGVDFGQAQDHTALAALGRRPDGYDVAGLYRFPLGLPYVGTPDHPGMGEQIRDLLSLPPLTAPGTILTCDYTGVGRAVVDALVALPMPCPVVPVTLTAGREATAHPGGDWSVPKRELVATLLALFGQGRLTIWEGQALAPVLRQELADFRVRVTAHAHETFSHRDGAHDDLLLAVGLAAWVGERFPPFTRDSLGRGGGRVTATAGADFRTWRGG
jgi:hypothetical protein